ncbi:MAG: nickel pincer cofactor biosynthesis protein LarB [Planctomycetota bacterium]
MNEPNDKIENLGFARIDHDREARCGFPEVVFAEGKTIEHCVAAANAILARAGRVLCTRVDAACGAALVREVRGATYVPLARCAYAGDVPRGVRGRIAVVSGGTADLPVAEEAALTAERMGAAVVRLFDVGVAGLHRLIAVLAEIRACRAVIAVAGMEGALPSVLAGLIDAPLIAVPTSVGYGVGQGGLSALATMLTACAPGIVCVNIDNGFGAAVAATRMLRVGAADPGRER